MTPDLEKTPPDWMCDPALQSVFDVLGAQTFLVGGCVRNWVMGRDVTDIDIATALTPDQVMECFAQAEIKVVPTGLAHGTVTAVLQDKTFEITTFRQDVRTDGRHADVSFSTDITTDAARRDFTMNALYADLVGHIYDPTGEGLADAQAGRVRFIGDPVQRIREDYLRILRFFRFYAAYGRGDLDDAGLAACRAEAGGLAQLSQERVTQEFFKILTVDHPVPVLKIMFQNNVLSIFPDMDWGIFERLCVLQTVYKAFDVMARLFVLAGLKDNAFSDVFVLSNAQKQALKALSLIDVKQDLDTEKAVKILIYRQGNACAMQIYLLWCVVNNAKEHAEYIELLKDWVAPVCPVTGDDLIAQGMPPGPVLGAKLKALEEEWLLKAFD